MRSLLSNFPLSPLHTHLLLHRGPRSALAILRPGLALSELAVSPLPGAPTAVFTLKASPDDEQDGFIVVSFSNATLVFEIGEEVKETSQSGFLATVATLHTQLLEDGSMLQVGACVCVCVWVGASIGSVVENNDGACLTFLVLDSVGAVPQCQVKAARCRRHAQIQP